MHHYEANFTRHHELPLHGTVTVGRTLQWKWRNGEMHAFDFDMTATGRTQWSWQQMVSHLDDFSLSLVLEDPKGRSIGILGCSIGDRPGWLDHKMQVQVDELQLPIFDFIIWRNDGSRWYMHPTWNGEKTYCHGISAPPAQFSLAKFTLRFRNPL